MLPARVAQCLTSGGKAMVIQRLARGNRAEALETGGRRYEAGGRKQKRTRGSARLHQSDIHYCSLEGTAACEIVPSFETFMIISTLSSMWVPPLENSFTSLSTASTMPCALLW